MNLGPLLTAVGLAAVKGEVTATARKALRRLAAAITSGLLFVIAAGFGLAALTDWLAGRLGTTEALAIVATGLVLLAFIIKSLSSLVNRRRSSPRDQRPPVADLAEALQAAGRPGSEMLALAIVAVVGFLLARQLDRR